jgi:hypothetical protein
MALVSCFWLQSKGQDHTITIHPNHRVASLLMSSSEYQAYVSQDQFNDNTVRQNLVKDIYKKFNDDFDFVFLVLNETSIPSTTPYYGQLIKVSNSVTGLGMGTYNGGTDYGSKGKLQAVMALTALTYVKSGPTLHEIMHNWGNFAIQTATYQGGSINNYMPHWGFTGGNTKGQLGGFKQSTLVAKGSNTYEVEAFGSFANGGNGLPYNQLEMYFMGMIPVSEVESFDVFSNISSATDGSNGKVEFVATTRTTWNAAKITADLGARNPSNTSSQKQFRALFVVLTPTALNETQWTSIDDQVSWFSKTESDGNANLYNFWEATNGKATINTSDIHLSTGIQDLAGKSSGYISVSPNPATDLIRLVSDDQKGFSKISIYNTLGQLMLESVPEKGLSDLEFNTSSLKNGYYTIHIEQEDGKTFYSRVNIAR